MSTEGKATAAQQPDAFVDLDAWRDFGHLQEVQVTDDPEGWFFDWGGMSGEELADSSAKRARVSAQIEERRPAREAALGFWIQPGPASR